MSDAIEQGQHEVLRMLREIAAEQGVGINSTTLWSDTPPTKYVLEVEGAAGWRIEKNITPEQLTGCRTDNQMKEQVRMKVESIVIEVKKHEARTDQ